jgi:hypothetical protein
MPKDSLESSSFAGGVDLAGMGEQSSLQVKEISTFKSLAELKELKHGWDGYGAIPISSTIVTRAGEFTHEYGALFPGSPQVVPMSKGRLQFEWHRGNRTLEIEFGESSEIHYLKWDSDLDIDEEDVVSTTDRSAISDVLGWFSSEMKSSLATSRTPMCTTHGTANREWERSKERERRGC